MKEIISLVIGWNRAARLRAFCKSKTNPKRMHLFMIASIWKHGSLQFIRLSNLIAKSKQSAQLKYGTSSWWERGKNTIALTAGEGHSVDMIHTYGYHQSARMVQNITKQLADASLSVKKLSRKMLRHTSKINSVAQ